MTLTFRKHLLLSLALGTVLLAACLTVPLILLGKVQRAGAFLTEDSVPGTRAIAEVAGYIDVNHVLVERYLQENNAEQVRIEGQLADIRKRIDDAVRPLRSDDHP